MQKVKVKTAALLERLQKNRDAHRELFEKAVKGYHRAATEELKAMLDEALAGKRIRRFVQLVEPVDKTREYNQVIEMLQMSVDAEIELTHSEFRNYVMDRWDWSDQVTASNAGYVQQ